MSHHLVTVCMFCLLCAAHSTCGAHINRFNDENDQAYSVVRFDQGTTERTLPFDLESSFREYDRDDETLDPFSLGNHGGKNEAEEKKKRYLRKLNKIRTHRKTEPHAGENIVGNSHTSDDSLSGNEHGVETLKDDSEINLDHTRISDLFDTSNSELELAEAGMHLPISEQSELDGDSEHDRLSELDVKQRSVRDVNNVSLSNINPSVYMKQIFRLFGDAETMTMNVSGLNSMLEHLDLRRILQGRQNTTDVDRPGNNKEKPDLTCLSSADLISNVNTRLKRDHHGHSEDHHGHNEDHHGTHGEDLLDEESLKVMCPFLLYRQLANASEDLGCATNGVLSSKMTAIEPSSSAYATRQMEVWVYSSLSIFAISACGLLGVAVVPIMHKNYYNHIMQFLIALAIGTLGGDAFLHLIPHALSSGHSHGSHALSSGHSHGAHDAEASHNDGMWKGLAAMMGVVFFYFIEKGLMVIAEWRKRRQKLDKENKLPSRVRVMKEGASGSKPTATASTSSFLKIFNSKCKKDEDPDTKSCKHKYSEYPYCYDEITTDTHDHHHHRDGQIPPSPKSSRRPNSVSVVSSNHLADKEEPTVRDWLLVKEEETKINGDSPHNDGVEMNNIKRRDGEGAKDLKDEESYTVILREHSRAHHGHSHSHGHVHSPPSSLSSVVWMVIMGDGLHNFTDGMAIGAAFASSIAVGFSTAIAVLCHELPHELGDFAVLLKAGMSVRRAIFYNVLSSVLCVAGMVCGVLVGDAPEATGWVFAVAAGLFIYIALADLVPELSSSHSKEGTLCQCMLQLLGLSTGIGIMLLIALYEHDLENMFG